MKSASALFSPENLHHPYTYDEYVALTDQLVAEKGTSGPNQSPKMAEYTRLNQYRMRRLDKTVRLDAELQQAAFQVSAPQSWYLLTETWCGDSAQSIPIIAKVAQLNPHITLTLLLRDENPAVMAKYLTNGAKSIPKLIALDAEGNEVFTWGPRPAPLQKIVLDHKQNPDKPYAEVQEEEQRWYNVDKAETLQRELTQLLKGTFVR